MTEYEETVQMANRILERPYADPDDDLAMLSRQFLRAVERAESAEKFKRWVHEYIDAHGVPHHPPGVHGAEGCRIGDRMDWLMAKLTAAEKERDELRRKVPWITPAEDNG